MSSASDFLGGGAAPLSRMVQHRVLVSSGTYVAASKGRVVMLAVGGGGSGGASFYRCTGGGAGECAYDLIDVLPGDTFTVTIGAGGAGISTSIGTPTNGNNGGTTAVTGPNSYSLTVAGGSGGLASGSVSTALNGGAGGTGGTGGTSNVVRRAGGRGGNIAAANTGDKATGGGGVNLFGYATNGGDLTVGVASAGGGVASAAGANGGNPGGPIANTSTALRAGLAPTDADLLGMRLAYSDASPTGGVGWGATVSDVTRTAVGVFGGSAGVYSTTASDAGAPIGGGGGGASSSAGNSGTGKTSGAGATGIVIFAEYMEA